MRLQAPFVLAGALILPATADAQDAEGSRDHQIFPDGPGCDIATYDGYDFAKFEFSLDPAKGVKGKY